jgi:ABC-type glycerol-3-phosphate transport system substrate-binding protein
MKPIHSLISSAIAVSVLFMACSGGTSTSASTDTTAATTINANDENQQKLEETKS